MLIRDVQLGFVTLQITTVQLEQLLKIVKNCSCNDDTATLELLLESLALICLISESVTGEPAIKQAFLDRDG